jgi:hypothetical protein
MRHSHEMRDISGTSSKIGGIGEASKTLCSLYEFIIQISQIHKSFEGNKRSYSNFTPFYKTTEQLAQSNSQNL